MFTGRLTIPYIDRMGVYGMKFRCLQLHDCKAVDCPKYLTLPGQELGLYNVLSLDRAGSAVHICEGEIDAIILSQVFPDDPVLGIPGAALWRNHFPFHLAAFERVVIWPDGDAAGKAMADVFRKHIRELETMPIPKGMDVNTVFLEHGAAWFHEAAQVETV